MTALPNRFRHLLPAAVLVVAVATGANTVAYSAIASAERVWDIELYDYCMDAVADDQMDYSIATATGGTIGLLRANRRSFHRRRLCRQMCGSSP